MRRPGELWRLEWAVRAVRSEVRHLRDLDDPSTRRFVVALQRTWLKELEEVLPVSLHEELHRLVGWLGNEGLSTAEVRLGLAQLEGWLDGVLSGVAIVASRGEGTKATSAA